MIMPGEVIETYPISKTWLDLKYVQQPVQIFHRKEWYFDLALLTVAFYYNTGAKV